MCLGDLPCRIISDEFIERIDIRSQHPKTMTQNPCNPYLLFSIGIQVRLLILQFGMAGRGSAISRVQIWILLYRLLHLLQSFKNQALFQSYLLTPSTPEDDFENVKMS